MRQSFFEINYELSREDALREIDERIQSGGKGYVVVADGVVLNTANRTPHYLQAVNGSMFSVCDSSFVPVYIRLIHGLKVHKYYGIDLMRDLIRKKQYKMAFLGGKQTTLYALREKLTATDPRIADMLFWELPFCDVRDFDYQGIAEKLNVYNADIIWVSLGAPKQEEFMSRMLPYLHRGVMISVGAAFNFLSGQGEKRAPQWMIDNNLEFVYRITQNPKKQLNRCVWIIRTLPRLLYTEWKAKRNAKHLNDYNKL